MIVQGHPPRGLSRLAFWAVVGLGLLLLPLLPVPAQQTGGAASDDEEQVQQPPPPRNPPASPEAPALKSAPAEGAPIRVDRAELIEAARDQVDLMEAKLNIKRAELEEMEMRIRLAQRNVKRLQELYEKGAMPETALIKARDEAELLPTQLPTKKAELNEAEILLKQAQRRLRRLELAEATAPGGKRGGMGRGSGPAGQPGMMGPSSAPPMQPKGAPMKGPGGLPAGGMSGPDSPSGKALPGAPPGSGMPGKMGPSLPGPGGMGTGAPALPGGPGAGMPPVGGPGLPQGPGAGPPAVASSDDAEGVVLESDTRTGQAIISIGSGSGIKAGSQLEVYRLKPNPKYLGKIEILAAQENRALGRLFDARFGPVEKGDLVASKVMDRLGGMVVGLEPNSDWADRLFEEKSWNFGTVRRGEELGHKFQLINKLEKPIHIAAVRSSAAYLTPHLVVVLEESGGAQAAVKEAWLGPHQSANIEVSIDTRRFVGDKTPSIYVQFDQPSVAQVQLQVHAKSVESPAGTAVKGEPQESKARILELELKVDQLMKQLDALRDELKKQPAKPRSGS